MEAFLHKLPLSGDCSFLFSRWDCEFFDKPWHFHEEFELVYIEKSFGTKMIGDQVDLFEEGDVYLIGPNIPHIFKNSETYYTVRTENAARSVFLHFNKNVLGQNFTELPEMRWVKKLLENAFQVLKVEGSTRERVVRRLEDMKEQNAARRMLGLHEILVDMSESQELKPLLATPFTFNSSAIRNLDTNRLNLILEYLMKHYNRKIYVSEVAALFNMSDAYFSRYFKQHTRKTFSKYLTEIRISQACRALLENEENITQIGFSSGFDNLSNFYRHFKKVTGLNPKQYQKKFLEVSGTGYHS